MHIGCSETVTCALIARLPFLSFPFLSLPPGVWLYLPRSGCRKGGEGRSALELGRALGFARNARSVYRQRSFLAARTSPAIPPTPSLNTTMKPLAAVPSASGVGKAFERFTKAAPRQSYLEQLKNAPKPPRPDGIPFPGLCEWQTSHAEPSIRQLTGFRHRRLLHASSDAARLRTRLLRRGQDSVIQAERQEQDQGQGLGCARDRSQRRPGCLLRLDVSTFGPPDLRNGGADYVMTASLPSHR